VLFRSRVGVFTPKMIDMESLNPGEIGFITASIKEVADTRVGDTITEDKNRTEKALPGFEPAQPVVFCGLFPVDAADFEDLRSAVGKLRLNDASFSYEMETSAALGFGFRCGFLGLLHLEIIQERLEREFNLDLYLIDWMEKFGFEYDVITDEDVHNEGLDILSPYQVLITGGHPEYYSKAMRDAVFDFTQTGGRLMYMGGNGFYWRVAVHEELPGVIEVRRCEAAIKTWEAETGEYYHSFTGEFGGIWRHQGDTAPQAIAGVGFVAEGFDISSYYRRRPEADDPRVAFMFDGVDDEILGDFGYHGEGAAGNELDRADTALGTPPHALIVARSENHTDLYVMVNEEVMVNTPGMTGTENELIHADMVFYETPNGGAVFATGSICYCASLPWNAYDNNIARLTTNVLKRFVDPKDFIRTDT